MWYTFGVDQSNPTWRIDRAVAQRRAIWASFAFFLPKADRFVLHYWPPDRDVEPFLALGFEPEPTYVSPNARQLSGPLTEEMRRLLFGRGEGEVPWFKVELERGGEPLYYVEEHESTAGWNCSEEDLTALYQAGVDRSVVMRYDQAQGPGPAVGPLPLDFLAAAVNQLIHPDATGYGCGFRPSGVAVIHTGPGEEVAVEYEEDALRMIDSLEAAEAALAGLHPPGQPGDRLRLTLVDGRPVAERISALLGPRRSGFTHQLHQPSRDEWVAALRTVAPRADHFVFCWREEPPGANGWRSDHGKARLQPFVVAEGAIDFPPGARQMVGRLCPDALEVICGEPPYGLPDLEHYGPTWQDGQSPSAPWWWLLLVAGQNVLLQSQGNGFQVDLALTSDEAERLDRPPGRLHDLALARRRGHVWAAVSRPWENRVRATRPGKTVQHFEAGTPRYLELRCDGEAIASLLVDSATLDALLSQPEFDQVLAEAPAPAHISLALRDGVVVWQQLDAPPDVDVPWRRPG